MVMELRRVPENGVHGHEIVLSFKKKTKQSSLFPTLEVTYPRSLLRDKIPAFARQLEESWMKLLKNRVIRMDCYVNQFEALLYMKLKSDNDVVAVAPTPAHTRPRVVNGSGDSSDSEEDSDDDDEEMGMFTDKNIHFYIKLAFKLGMRTQLEKLKVRLYELIADDNAFMMYQELCDHHPFILGELKKKLVMFLEAHFTDILKAHKWCFPTYLRRDVLLDILRMNIQIEDEVMLIVCVTRWAEKKIEIIREKRAGSETLEANPETLRNFLGKKIIKSLRLPLLDQESLDIFVSNVHLTPKETDSIKQRQAPPHLWHKGPVDDSFNYHPRNVYCVSFLGAEENYVFDMIINNTSGIVVTKRSIKVKCDRRILVECLEFFAIEPEVGETLYVDLELFTEHGEKMVEFQKHELTKRRYFRDTAQLRFDKPLRFKKNQFYIIEYSVKNKEGIPRSYGIMEKYMTNVEAYCKWSPRDDRSDTIGPLKFNLEYLCENNNYVHDFCGFKFYLY